MFNTNNNNDNNNKDNKADKSFDINEFCTRHFRFQDSDRNIDYSPRELHELVDQATEIFKREPTLATLSPPCTIVGDIHGQYRDLHRILNARRERHTFDVSRIPKTKFMFLGDFVDRGPQSVECIALVFSLKVLYPGRYMLLRGNHETKSINFTYGFREELVNKLGPNDGVEVWEHFNDAFSWMPLAGLVGGKILCMHGGISPWLNSLNDIRMIQRPLVDANDNKLALDLLWSDPWETGNLHMTQEKAQFLKNTLRGLSVNFNDQAISDCVRKLDLQLIVRAHQVQDRGFRFTSNRKLVTIFSAPRYMNETDNRGAVLKVNGCGAISVVILRARPLEKAPKVEKIETTKLASIVDGDDSHKKKEQSTQSLYSMKSAMQ